MVLALGLKMALLRSTVIAHNEFPANTRNGGAHMPFSDSGCWQEVGSLVRTLQNRRGVTDLQNTVPKKDANCDLFSYSERTIVALTLMQCRLKERQGIPGRDTEMVSASELNKVKDKDSDGQEWADYSCIDPTRLTEADQLSEIESQLANCFKRMTNYEFHLYVEHINHIENLCFHVHSVLWQQSTEQILTSLSESAADVSEKLLESSAKFAQLATKQEASLHLQERILRNGESLHDIVESGNSRVQNAFDHMRSQVEQEHEKVLNLFGDIFQGVNKLTAFQQFLKMKVLDVQAVCIYAFMIFLTYHMTSAVKTQNARAPLIGLWTAGLAIELIAGRFMNNEDVEYQQRMLVTVTRYGFAIIGAVVWLRAYILYEDPYSRVLNEVQSQMYVLEHKMDRCLKKASTLPAVDTAVVRRGSIR